MNVKDTSLKKGFKMDIVKVAGNFTDASRKFKTELTHNIKFSSTYK